MTEEQRETEFVNNRSSLMGPDTTIDQAVNTFSWVKNIFSSWITDQTDNYRNFFQFGLKPVTDQDLLIAKASFQKGLDDVNAELEARGL